MSNVIDMTPPTGAALAERATQQVADAFTRILDLCQTDDQKTPVVCNVVFVVVTIARRELVEMLGHDLDLIDAADACIEIIAKAQDKRS